MHNIHWFENTILLEERAIRDSATKCWPCVNDFWFIWRLCSLFLGSSASLHLLAFAPPPQCVLAPQCLHTIALQCTHFSAPPGLLNFTLGFFGPCTTAFARKCIYISRSSYNFKKLRLCFQKLCDFIFPCLQKFMPVHNLASHFQPSVYVRTQLQPPLNFLTYTPHWLPRAHNSFHRSSAHMSSRGAALLRLYVSTSLCNVSSLYLPLRFCQPEPLQHCPFLRICPCVSASMCLIFNGPIGLRIFASNGISLSVSSYSYLSALAPSPVYTPKLIIRLRTYDS